MGKLYTLTALPAAGQQFAGWTGDLVSMEPTIQVVVSSNLLLQANFIPNPYRPVAGSYNGLFYEEDQVHAASAGAFTLALTTGGAYSGKLQLGKSKIKFTGKLGLDSRGTNVIVRKGATPLTLKLRFEDNGLSKELAGELTDGHWVAQLSGDRAGFDGVVHPAPYAGNYTVIFPGDAGGSGPEGHGYGMLRVDSSGKMRFAGKLADGTKVSQSAVLGLSGQWPLYVPLYSGAGALVSWITFADRERDDLNGGLAWVKLPGGKSRVYPQGFSMETQAVGSRYRILPGGGALNLAAGKVEFYGGNLPAAFTNYIAFGLKSKVSNQSVNALALSISAKNGTFKGKVTEPSSGRSFAFGGAILQKMNSGFGFLTGTDSTSSLELTQ